MAGQASTVGSKIGLDACSGRATQTARTMYLALLTAACTDSTTMGTMTELTTPGTNGYSRQSVTFTDPAATEESHNSALLVFGPFTTDLASCGYCALVSASTGTTGDLVWYWTLDVAKDPASGDTIEFAIGDLSMSLE